MNNYKPLFPWFGGKSKVSNDVWRRFGNVKNYVEPFFGSGAVLFTRPHNAKIETINDADGYVCNFWRAVQDAPDDVTNWLDWPVSELDLHARHQWLVDRKEGFTDKLIADPEFYDAKVAGWWVWGICQWIGSGWCKTPDKRIPHLGDAGKGVHRKRPSLGNAGKGVHRQIPHLGNAGMGVALDSRMDLLDWFSRRLRSTRVVCGDWSRVTSKSVTYKNGLTGVFLDPPYTGKASRDSRLYATDSLTVGHDAAQWAMDNGDNPKMRIAMCGYDGEHDFPDSWECLPWKTHGGYATQGTGGNENSARERIWFSPHCLKPQTKPMLPFEGL